jgi:hypothetical protein
MKTYKETIKTIALTALATAIVAFIAGVHYEQGNTKRLETMAKGIVPPVQATVSK